MINYLLHYLSIHFKVVLITITATYHRIYLFIKYPYEPKPITYTPELLREEWHALDKSLEVDAYGLIKLSTNNDHQALRHGSLLWSAPTQARVDAMEHLFVDGQVVRGVGVTSPAPPAMPMSVAFGITSALDHGMRVSPALRELFANSVFVEQETAFIQGADTSVIPRLKSTAFDAIYALSLLYTADRLDPKESYKKSIRDILFKKGYALLLLAPLTYTTEGNRGYFRDHIAIMGLYTCFRNCQNKWLRRLYAHALSFIASQSYAYCNPYFAALAAECGVLPKRQRLKVLSLHNNISLAIASICSPCIEDDVVPSPYSTHNANEFSLDELGRGGVRYGKAVMVPLNGLCLGKSLCIVYGNG